MSSRLILIGGTSHTGKSTLARDFGERLGADVISTDALGRHPGRPWGDLATKPHVVDYYSNTSTQAQLTEVLAHYKTNIWPEIVKLLDAQSGPLVLEGSALLPELVAGIGVGTERAWLVEPEDILQNRIYQSSNYISLPPDGQELVDSFLARSLAYQSWLEESLKVQGDCPGIPSSLVDV